jgi:hypothetical protein
MLPARLEAPTAFAVSESGQVAVLDRGGARLLFGREEPLETPATALAFHGDSVAVLFHDRVVTFGRDRGVVGAVPVREGATALAISFSGGVLVGYGPSAHGVVVERLGENPLALYKPTGFAVRALAVDTGGFWMGGDTRLIGFRPTLGGVTIRADLPIDAAARAMAIGPDGSLYVLLADGRRLVRVRDGVATDAGAADEELCGIARRGPRLLGCGATDLVDLSRHVLPPPEKGPEFQLPACD